MNCWWVVPYAGRNPPAGMTPPKGAHNTCRFERTGELPPAVDNTGVPPFLAACGWCPMPGGTLPCLWVVPYAGRNPP